MAGKFAPYIDQRYSMATTQRPRDLVSSGYGAYGLATSTGKMAAGIAAASEFLQFRWVPSNTDNVARIHRVSLTVSSNDAGFTAGEAFFSMKIARSWTAAGTGGGTATITGNNGKLREDMGTMLLSSLRTATTAALGAGTKTFDSQPVVEINCGVGTATYTQFVGTAGNPVVLFAALPGEEPITLENQEGFSLLATVPATGTWKASVSIQWSEMGKAMI